MKIIGITGGVGSGKSRVLYALENTYGAYVIEADKLAHELMEPDKIIYKRIVGAFGKEILSEDGRIDRNKLGEIVFHDNEKRNMLNGISHPLVKEEIKNRISSKEKEGTGLLVIEAALLIQDGYKDICDEIWYIHVGRKERMKRLMKQRGYSEAKCNSIFDSQEPDEYYMANSDRMIENDGDFNKTEERIKSFVEEICV